MLKAKSKSLHPALDFKQASRVFREAKVHQDLTGELITSPHDLFSVEQLRSKYGLRTKKQFPADIFVFGKGKPPRADLTQIGGKPYWPKDRPWPANSRGVPLRFLAQFNFADSRDLFPELPGNVLVILVEDAETFCWEPERIRFYWFALGIDTVMQFPKAQMATSAGPFYGVIYRSADYPDAEPVARELDVRQSYNLAILNGTKIGGVPNFIQGGVIGGVGQFLCQLGSIQAAPEVPYPWIGRKTPLSLAFTRAGIYGEKNSVVFGDMGNFYFYLNPNGSITTHFECY